MERLETRHRCCTKQKVKRGLWSPEEDEKLVSFISSHGLSSWSSVPKLAGLQRCGKSCRLRWINYLRPDLKKGSFTEEEERTIIEVHRIIGNRWAQIAKHLPGRTDNEVKNFWNSSIKKKLLSQGLDPTTHNLLPKKAMARPKLPVDATSIYPIGYSGFGWNRVLGNNDPCFPAIDETTGFRPGVGNSTWVEAFEDQYAQHDDDPREEERVEMAVEEAEMEGLRRVQMDGHMGFGQGATSNIGYNYSSDHFGFGDYTAVLQSSGVFGDDIVLANGGDQLGSSYMNSILASGNSSSLYP